MKRKLFAFLAALVLFSSLPVSAFANDQPSFVIDAAGILSYDEIISLEETAQVLRSDYKMDIVILTVPTLDGNRPQDYADDFFDANGYGYGDNYSGILLLLSMEERDWYISTSGNGIFVLTDYGIQACMEIPLSYFSQDDYYGGFNSWLNALPEYLDAFHSGTPIDGQADYSQQYYHGDQGDILYYEEKVTPSLSLSLIIGLVVAGITVLIMRFSMNTKRAKGSASDYLKAGSYHLRTHQDIFLYSDIKKTRRPKEDSSSRGGGSSVHRSSSGRSHGGSGGKF